MADACDVDTRTFYRWMNAHPELNDAVSSGKDAFDTRVERALAERAVGYSVDVEEWFVVKGELVSRTVRKHYPPNVTACIFFLKNRQPEKWRDVQRHEVNATGLKSSDELRQLLALEFQDLIDQGQLMLPAPGRNVNDRAEPTSRRRGTAGSVACLGTDRHSADGNATTGSAAKRRAGS
jgi:hypothetical protein